MNSFVSHSLATVVGAGIGAAIGYFIAKSKYENDVEVQVRERVGNVVRMMNDAKTEKKETEKEEVSHEEPKEKKSPKREEIGLKEAYNKMIKSEKYSKDEPSDLYRIDDTTFADDDRDCFSLFYNPDLDVLLNDDGEEVEVRQIYVGDFDLMEYFEDDDNDSLYFRDDKLGRDYEILRTMKGPDED